MVIVEKLLAGLICFASIFTLSACNTDEAEKSATPAPAPTPEPVVVSFNEFYNWDIGSFEIGYPYDLTIEEFLSNLDSGSWRCEYIDENTDLADIADYTGEIEIIGSYLLGGYEAQKFYLFIEGKLTSTEYLYDYSALDGDILSAFYPIFAALDTELEGLPYFQSHDFSYVHTSSGSALKPFPGFWAEWRSKNLENPTSLWLSAIDGKKAESFIRIVIGKDPV